MDKEGDFWILVFKQVFSFSLFLWPSHALLSWKKRRSVYKKDRL